MQKRNQYPRYIYYILVFCYIFTYILNKGVILSHAEDAYSALPREYVITYHLNGGTNQNNPIIYHDGEVLLLYPAVRTGYNFVGWYDNANLAGEPVTAITSGTGGLHYYAKWERQIYQIHYQYSGGKAMGSNPASFRYKAAASVLFPAGRKGYQFQGWYCTATKKRITVLKGINSDITLKAHFKKLKVKKAKGLTVKRSPQALIIQVKAQKNVAGYELQYWKKGGKKITLAGDVTRYQLLKFSRTKDYSFRVRCFQYDSIGSKVYGSYSKTVTLKGEKPEEENEKKEDVGKEQH